MEAMGLGKVHAESLQDAEVESDEIFRNRTRRGRCSRSAPHPLVRANRRQRIRTAKNDRAFILGHVGRTLCQVCLTVCESPGGHHLTSGVKWDLINVHYRYGQLFVTEGTNKRVGDTLWSVIRKKSGPGMTTVMRCEKFTATRWNAFGQACETSSAPFVGFRTSFSPFT